MRHDRISDGTRCNEEFDGIGVVRHDNRKFNETGHGDEVGTARGAGPTYRILYMKHLISLSDSRWTCTNPGDRFYVRQRIIMSTDLKGLCKISKVLIHQSYCTVYTDNSNDKLLSTTTTTTNDYKRNII